MPPATKWIPALCAAALICACSREARQVGPTPPQTRPAGDNDPRIAAYQANLSQVSQGARYFAWYGCSACHDDAAKGVRNLSDDQWRYGYGFVHVYDAIAGRHGRLAYGKRVPVEQLWQLSAYVRDLSTHYPEKRRRTDLDQKAEPVGAIWQGPQ